MQLLERLFAAVETDDLGTPSRPSPAWFDLAGTQTPAGFYIDENSAQICPSSTRASGVWRRVSRSCP